LLTTLRERKREGHLNNGIYRLHCRRGGPKPIIFSHYDFQFENGAVLPELWVAYETPGQTQSRSGNAILLIHGAGGNRSGRFWRRRIAGLRASEEIPVIVIPGRGRSARAWNL
jgi:hypothetical protein